MNPVECVNDRFVGVSAKPGIQKFEHFSLIERKGAEIGLEDLTQEHLQLENVLLFEVFRDGPKPFGNQSVPRVKRNDVIGHQREEFGETLIYLCMG
jgi:hypothetical protein